MRVTTKGQVTIPIEIRGKAGILPNMAKKQPRRGKDLIKQMRGRGTVRMITDEIMALTRDYRTYFPRQDIGCRWFFYHRDHEEHRENFFDNYL